MGGVKVLLDHAMSTLEISSPRSAISDMMLQVNLSHTLNNVGLAFDSSTTLGMNRRLPQMLSNKQSSVTILFTEQICAVLFGLSCATEATWMYDMLHTNCRRD